MKHAILGGLVFGLYGVATGLLIGNGDIGKAITASFLLIIGFAAGFTYFASLDVAFKMKGKSD